MTRRLKMIPLDNGKALDRSKVAAIAASLASDGWQGRPLLGVSSGETIYLLTGSHRYAAARKVKLPVVPVHSMKEDLTGNPVCPSSA